MPWSTDWMTGLSDRISTAITPAILLSMTALLIGNVGAQDADLSERIRGLTRERRETTNENRRASITEQLRYFERRVVCSQWAHLLLYCAELLFVLLVISLTFRTQSGVLEAVFFVGGLVLLAAALAFEVHSLSIAGRTMVMELGSDSSQGEPRSTKNSKRASTLHLREPSP